LSLFISFDTALIHSFKFSGASQEVDSWRLSGSARIRTGVRGIEAVCLYSVADRQLRGRLERCMCIFKKGISYLAGRICSSVPILKFKDKYDVLTWEEEKGPMSE
jgi:hypothetical protein